MGLAGAALPAIAGPPVAQPSVIRVLGDETIAITSVHEVELAPSALQPAPHHFAAVYGAHHGWARVADPRLGRTPVTLSLAGDATQITLHAGQRYTFALAVDGPADLTLPKGVNVVGRVHIRHRGLLQEQQLTGVPGIGAAGSLSNLVGARHVSSVAVLILWATSPDYGTYVAGACYSTLPVTTCKPNDSGQNWTGDEYIPTPRGPGSERMLIGESYGAPHRGDTYVGGTAMAPASSRFVSVTLLAFGMNP